MNTAFLKSYQTLREVYQNRAFSSVALNRSLNVCKNQDKALVTKIVYGVLDNDGKLNYVISRFVRKMPKGDALLILKMGAYCLAELSIPVYAVVNDFAELAKITEDKRIVGFVNATLKSIAPQIKNFDDYPDDPIQRLALSRSYPEWAVRKLVKDYGFDVARQIVSYDPPRLTTLRLHGIAPAEFARRFATEVQPTIFDDAVFVKGVPHDGSVCTAQSLSSMAIARICAAITPRQGKFLDCCAAPGGKSVYFKQLSPAAEATACDVHPHRVELIQSYARRMDVQLATYCRDMTQPASEWNGAFDTVLCDVPCSGFGVLDTRPDIKLFRENKDISELMKLQYAILNNCSEFVKAGGSLVYSTCTLFDNENGQNVRKFLKNHSDFDYGRIILPQIAAADGKGFYQFLPHADGMQGFYVAVLTRRGS